MTEKNFLVMISEELDKLNQEYDKYEQLKDELSKTTQNTSELVDVNYKKDLIENKKYDLIKLINLPRYARIMVMSDIEIEEYKKEEINKLQLKIDEIKKIINQSKLKKHNEISKNEVANLYNIINSFQKEINEIENKTTKEIKQQLLLNIKEKDAIEEIINFINVSEGTYFDLLGTVGPDSEKAYKIANLLKEYKIISDNMKDEKCNIKDFLPSEFYEKLIKYNSDFFTDISILLDYNKLVDKIKKYEEEFNVEKDIFKNEFTENKLSKLIDFNNDEIFIDKTKVDFVFLQQHSNKLGYEYLKKLKTIVDKRDNLLKLIVKSENIKNEIDNLNNLIIEYQSVGYEKLLGWYLSKKDTLLGINFLLCFNSDNLTQTLADMQKRINENQEIITELKIYIKKEKKVIEQRKKVMNQKEILFFKNL